MGMPAIYINGELFLESAPDVIGSLEPFPITNVVFGSAENGGSSYNGLIDEITVWDGALNEDEILDVMEDGPDLGGPGPGPEPKPRFVRGDANADGQRNITDAVFVLNFLFGSGEDPTCMDTADINDDGSVNITDGVYVLNFLFASGSDPLSPFPDCGPDPTDDVLSCAAYDPCP